MTRTTLLAALAAVLLAAPGCSSVRSLGHSVTQVELERVKPWERDILARPDMAWQPDRLRSAAHSHIYFSKEGSLVGGGAGGGGCGCN